MRNRKKVITFFLVMVMIWMFSMTVLATESKKGSIEIILTDGEKGTSKENVEFEYIKVADLINGEYYVLKQYEKAAIDFNNIKYSNQIDEAAQKLDKYVVEGKTVKTDSKGEAIMNDLEVGVYLLRVVDKANYEQVTPTLISIPTWNQEEDTMDYHITLIPKHGSDKVVTGDGQFFREYIALFGISFIFLVGLSCHTHFKCGKIAGNYSEKGGHTHGNDNDTKDSRCTRRVRPRGGRSIN